MNTIVLKPNDLDRLISEMKTIFTQSVKEVVVEKPLCIKEAAAYLKIGKSTLHKRIQNGTIPSELVHRNDGSVYFLPSELHQFIKKS